MRRLHDAAGALDRRHRETAPFGALCGGDLIDD
jgi:hypothetical protein